ncbi:MAG: protein kinase [Gemmatimonadetes bacterium]|nr:protein kinase [Gemmatimonadota bacterium]
MKLCPTCGNQWPDEQKFCPNDGSALKTAGARDLVGSVIAGNYHIEKKLGEGGMGAVYLGQHVKMGRKSAIKVMTQSMANDPDAIARFNREATNAARINHPNVCAIYDFGETPDGLIYLAMEFIEGESLSHVLEREGALPPKRGAQIFQQAAEALQAAHDLGIVHRDLKPDNIMITRGRGGADVVKVVDFGIAKAVGGEEGQKVTKTGLVVGTPEYMSPEQLAGDKLDGRSDIYSLALVLYRMLTGTLPFQADSAQEVMIKRLTDEPMPLNAAGSGTPFPDQLQAVMDRALQRLPGERYASAAEMARDVVVAVGGMGDTALAVDTEGATQIISATPATGATVAATRVAGAGAPARGQKTRVPTPDTPAVAAAPPAPVKKKPVMAIAATVAVLAVGGGTAAVVLSRGGETSPPSVTPDTAQQGTAGNRSQTQGTATGRDLTQRRQTTDTQTTAIPPRDTTPARGEAPPAERGIRVSVANAQAHLDALFELFDPGGNTPAYVASAIKDTASAYYHAAGLSRKQRAWAAYVLANAEGALDNRSEALRWAREAVSLDGTVRAYQAMVQSLTRPQ